VALHAASIFLPAFVVNFVSCLSAEVRASKKSKRTPLERIAVIAQRQEQLIELAAAEKIGAVAREDGWSLRFVECDQLCASTDDVIRSTNQFNSKHNPLSV
jgi:hypothetical protein